MRLNRLMAGSAALTLLAAGCGGSSQSQRGLLTRYVRQVNQVENGLAAPLRVVVQNGREFASERAAGVTSPGNLLYLSHERALEVAASQIRAARKKLAAIPVPAAALHLRSLLLQLLDGQVYMTGQVAEMVVFLPRFQQVLEPLGPATNRLETALSNTQASGAAAVAAVFDAKAAALLRFKAVVDVVVRYLRRLQAPAVSMPGYRAQISALEGMSSSAAKLAHALRAGGQGNLAPLLADFNRAAASSQTLAVQRAQIAAIRSYDAQSTRLAGLARKVELERLRLANTLR